MQGQHDRGPPGCVAATTDADSAARSRWRAVVIGAGPAGSAVAARLATRGLTVLLLDAAAMPRPKLCGCCLSTTAIAELAELAIATRGDPDPLPPSAVPLTVVHLATPAVAAALPLPGGAIISREALDSAGVHRAIASGAGWLPNARVTAVRPPERSVGPVQLEFADAAGRCRTLSADVAVIASGLAATLRDLDDAAGPGWRVAAGSRIGLGTTLPELPVGAPAPGELVMAVASQGYCGIVRLEDGRIDLAAAIDRQAVIAAGSPAAAVGRILAATGIGGGSRQAAAALAERLAAATFRGTPALTRARPPVAAAGRIVRIGDAAGYVEPFTGEGMGWAIASARLCDEAYGPALEADVGPDADLAPAGARFASLHARGFSGHHARCRRIALAVRRPWLVGSALRLARFAPGLAARFVPLVVGAASRREAVG